MTFKDMQHSFHDLDREHILAAIGLQQQRSTMDKVLPALAFLGTGLLVGVGVGLLLAPRPGRDLREDIRLKLRRAAASSAGLEAPTHLDGALRPS